MTMFF